MARRPRRPRGAVGALARQPLRRSAAVVHARRRTSSRRPVRCRMSAPPTSGSSVAWVDHCDSGDVVTRRERALGGPTRGPRGSGHDPTGRLEPRRQRRDRAMSNRSRGLARRRAREPVDRWSSARSALRRTRRDGSCDKASTTAPRGSRSAGEKPDREPTPSARSRFRTARCRVEDGRARRVHVSRARSASCRGRACVGAGGEVPVDTQESYATTRALRRSAGAGQTR